MEILILIFRAFGILLLAILLLVLLLLLLVLLAPVRYRLCGTYREKPAGRLKAGWPFWLLSGEAVYEEGALSLTVRAFGLRVLKRQLSGGNEDAPEPELSEESTAPEKEAEGSDRPQETEPVPAPAAQAAGGGRPQKTGAAPEKEKDSVLSPTEDDGRETLREAPEEPPGTAPDQREEAAGGFAAKGKRLCERISASVHEIVRKKEMLEEKKNRLFEILTDEENRKTFGLLRRQIFRLLRHVLPYRADGWVKFGFEDPYTTGQVLTYASPFYALYARHVTLTPVFGEKELSGELTLRGRIRVGTVLVLGLRLILNKNFRRLLGRLREK